MPGSKNCSDCRCETDMWIPRVDILGLEAVPLSRPSHLETFLNQLNSILLYPVGQMQGVVNP